MSWERADASDKGREDGTDVKEKEVNNSHMTNIEAFISFLSDTISLVDTRIPNDVVK